MLTKKLKMLKRASAGGYDPDFPLTNEKKNNIFIGFENKLKFIPTNQRLVPVFSGTGTGISAEIEY